MESLSLARDGFQWSLAADPQQLSLIATSAAERFVLKISCQDVPAATNGKLRVVDECYKLIKSALLARAGTLFIQPSISRQGGALIFQVKGSMVPSGQCDFALIGEQQQSIAAAPVVALPGFPSQLPVAAVAPQPTKATIESESQQPQPMSLLSGIAARKQGAIPPQAQVVQPATMRTGSPMRGRADGLSPMPGSSPVLNSAMMARMSAPASALPHLQSNQAAQEKVKRRTVMTLYRQLREQLGAMEEAGEDKLPKFQGDIPSTLNVLASTSLSNRKSINIAGRPFRGRSSTELLSLVRQLESKPLSSNSVRPLPSKVHLMVEFKNLGITTPFGTESIELQWNVYHVAAAESALYEPIRLTLGPDGKPVSGTKLTRAIFSNLPIPPQEALIVCKVFRNGVLESVQPDPLNQRNSVMKDSSKSPVCRRPVGTAVLELGTLQTPIQVEGTESYQTIMIYAAHDENMSSGLHYLMRSKVRQGFEDMKLLPACKGIQMAVALLSDNQLKSHSDQGVPIAPARLIPLGFKESARNELYVTINDASFPAKTPTSLQVTMRLMQGDTALPWISRGYAAPMVDGKSLDDPTTYTSFVIQDINFPRWEETVCIRLPSEVVIDSATKGPLTLQFSIEKLDQKKTKEIAQGQLQIVESLTGVILDSTHEVQCSAPKAQGLKKVTDKAFVSKDRSGTLVVRTMLSSNTIVRNPHLARLFQWRIMGQGEILEMLARLSTAHEEMLSFIPDTIDSLSAILDSVDDDTVAVAVFSALTFIIDQVCDERRSKDVRTLLYSYIDGPRCILTKRAAARLHRAMSQFFTNYRSHSVAQMSFALGSIDIMHRFIQRGRTSTSQAAAHDEPRHFSLLMMTGMKNLMSETDPSFFGPQVMAVVKLEHLLPFLRLYMAPSEASSALVSVLAAVPIQSTWNTTVALDESASPALIARVVNEHLRSVVKLEFIERMLARGDDGPLGDKDARGILWPSLLEITRRHLLPLNDKSTEVEEDALHYAASVFQRMISLVQKGSSWEHLRPSLLSILPSLFVLWQSLQQFSETVSLVCDVAIVILALLYVATADEFTQYTNDVNNRAAQEHLLTQLCRSLSSMITKRRAGTPFPSQWTEFIALQLRSTHSTIFNVQNMLTQMPSLAASGAVVSEYLQLLFAFVNSPHVRADGQQQLQLSSKKGTAEMAEELIGLVGPVWRGLDPESQLLVAEELMGAILKASLTFNPASIGQAAGALFQAMLQRCYAQTGREVRIRTRIIRTIIQNFATFFVPRSRGRPREFVTGWMQKLISEPPPDPSIPEVPHAIKQQLIDDITIIISVVAEIESLPSDKWFAYRVARTNFLLEHLHQLGETAEYIRILQVLYEVHKKAGNVAQAAFALQLNINLLEFDENKKEEALNDLPLQSSAERKVELMRRAIQLFTRGRLYEEAIDLSGKLGDYFRRAFRFPDLRELLQSEQTLLSDSIAPTRNFPLYYYVAFNGDKFPEWLRDREYVHVSYAREGASDVGDKIRQDWSDVRVMNFFLTKQEVTAMVAQQVQCVQVVPVTPGVNESVLTSWAAAMGVPLTEHMRNWIQNVYPGKFTAAVRPEPTQEYEHVITLQHALPSLLAMIPVDVHSVSGPKTVQPAAFAPRNLSPPPAVSPQTGSPVSGSPASPQPRAIPIAQHHDNNQPFNSAGSNNSHGSASSGSSGGASTGSSPQLLASPLAGSPISVGSSESPASPMAIKLPFPPTAARALSVPANARALPVPVPAQAKAPNVANRLPRPVTRGSGAFPAMTESYRLPESAQTEGASEQSCDASPNDQQQQQQYYAFQQTQQHYQHASVYQPYAERAVSGAFPSSDYLSMATDTSDYDYYAQPQHYHEQTAPIQFQSTVAAPSQQPQPQQQQQQHQPYHPAIIQMSGTPALPPRPGATNM